MLMLLSLIVCLFSCAVYLHGNIERNCLELVLLASIIVAVVSGIVGLTYVKNSYYYGEPEIVRTQKIVFLNENATVHGEISGSSRYFSGSVNEEQSYAFYYIKKENVIARDSIPANKTDIVYDAECEDEVVVETWKSEKKTDLNRTVIFLFGIPDNLEFETQIWYELHLPEGIVEEALILDNN